MEYFLVAIIATIGLVLDYLWKSDVSSKRLKHSRTAMVWAVIFLVWILSWRQWHAASVSSQQAEFIRNRLAEATISLSNMTAVATNMQAEITQFRKQVDVDQVQLFGQMIDILPLPDDQREFTKGLYALHTGRADAAKGFFRRTILLNPKHSKAHNNLALLLQGEEAAEHYHLAFEADTNNAPAALNYAGVLMRRGDTSNALEVVCAPDNLKEIDPVNLLHWAKILSISHKTNFWQFLDDYVRLADPPHCQDILFHR